jgi:hypothetical protein
MKRSFLVLLAPALLSGCHYETVDPAPAVAVAQGFYGALEAGNPTASLGYFSHDFSADKQWPRLLIGLNDRYGPVMSAELQDTSLTSNGKSPCYLLAYLVKRNTLEEDDLLFVCRDQDSSRWSIRGHKLTRRDTKQSIVGGVLPKEVGVKIP